MTTKDNNSNYITFDSAAKHLGHAVHQSLNKLHHTHTAQLKQQH